jgi:hypothetical protein
MGKRSIPKKSDVLSASEIGQYLYCSYAWFLQRCGYEPVSPFLESGKQSHIRMGNTIDSLGVKTRRARWYAITGLVIVCIAVLLVLFEVVL